MMRRSNIIQAFVVFLLFLVLLPGSFYKAQESDVAGKAYVYTGEPFTKMEGDDFVIYIKADGTFQYCESAASSYLGIGEWTVKDGVLTLIDDKDFCGYRKNSFRIDGDDLIFLEEDSMNFIYIRVKDGERFEGMALLTGQECAKTAHSVRI